MNCHNCGAELSSGAVSCRNCGTRLQLNCPTCQHLYAPGNRFCGNCGRRLNDATAPSPVAAPPVAPNLSPAGEPEQTPEPPEPPASPEPPIACSRCFRNNDRGADYCFACGFPLNEAAAYRQAPAMGRQPELAAFELGTPGGFFLRTAAYLIDSLVIIFPMVIVWYALGMPVPETEAEIIGYLENPPEEFQTFLMVNVILDLLYRTIFVALFATTPGKRIFSMYVVRGDGSRISHLRVLARQSLVALLHLIPFGVFVFLVVAFRQDRRGLHDLICDTVVIRRQRQPVNPDSRPR